MEATIKTRHSARVALQHHAEQDHYDDRMVAKILRAANSPPVDKPMTAEEMLKAIDKGE